MPPRLSAPIACACLRPCACAYMGTRVLCECVTHTCTRAAQAHTHTLKYTKTTRETRTLPAIRSRILHPMHPHFLTRFCPLKKVLEAKIKTRAAPGYWQREPGQRRTAASRPVRILNSQCPGKCARNYNKYLGESAQERERAREREGGMVGKGERASERESARARVCERERLRYCKRNQITTPEAVCR